MDRPYGANERIALCNGVDDDLKKSDSFVEHGGSFNNCLLKDLFPNLLAIKPLDISAVLQAPF